LSGGPGKADSAEETTAAAAGKAWEERPGSFRARHAERRPRQSLIVAWTPFEHCAARGGSPEERTPTHLCRVQAQTDLLIFREAAATKASLAGSNDGAYWTLAW
jgi:hypothetical protein